MGSSPLTRGKRGEDRFSRPRLGLIPAHAGKTANETNVKPYYEAHPRSRGENTRNHKLGLPGKGSSPLTRGKRCGQCCARGSARLIPAHAGKTAAREISDLLAWAHPRSRGENWQWIAGLASEVGSSPLTRGKLQVQLGLQVR